MSLLMGFLYKSEREINALSVECWYKYVTQSGKRPCWVRTRYHCSETEKHLWELGSCRKDGTWRLQGEKNYVVVLGGNLMVEEPRVFYRAVGVAVDDFHPRKWGDHPCPPFSPLLLWQMPPFVLPKRAMPKTESESRPDTVGREKVGMKETRGGHKRQGTLPAQQELFLSFSPCLSFSPKKKRLAEQLSFSHCLWAQKKPTASYPSCW